MPKKLTKRETKRAAPYNLRPDRTNTSVTPITTTMAATVASPMQHSPWVPHHSYSTSWSHPHMGYDPQPMMPTYIPMAPPQPALPQPGQSAPWTIEEDNILIDAKAQGLGWNEIHDRYFKAKSGNACRKRHERLMVKLRTTDWDETRIRKVMNAYNAPGLRQQLWSRVAAEVDERWEDVERVCFQQGLKGLRTSQSSGSGGTHSRGRSRASSGQSRAQNAYATDAYEHVSDEGYDQLKYGEQQDDKDDSGFHEDLGGPGPSEREAGAYNHASSHTLHGLNYGHSHSSSRGGYDYR